MQLTEIYNTLRKRRLCKNGGITFSVRFLGRKKSYFSVINARNRQPSTQAMMCLYFKLNEQAELIKDNDISFLYQTRQHLLKMSGEVFRDVQLRCSGDV